MTYYLDILIIESSEDELLLSKYVFFDASFVTFGYHLCRVMETTYASHGPVGLSRPE